MNLDPEPFSKIREGSKTVELRLYDEKRRRISPGDTIRFANARRPGETVLTRVQAPEVFSSFAELYGALPLLEFGCRRPWRAPPRRIWSGTTLRSCRRGGVWQASGPRNFEMREALLWKKLR